MGSKGGGPSANAKWAVEVELFEVGLISKTSRKEARSAVRKARMGRVGKQERKTALEPYTRLSGGSTTD
jgi:hypothetical protein